MTVSSAQILTPETIPKYLKERLNALKGVVYEGDTEDMKVEPIAGGNVNYAFGITLDDQTKIFLKQAPEFVAIFGPDGLPLTSERMQREMDVYSEWKGILEGEAAEMLPDIYYFDLVMQFLDGFELLDHVLVEHAGSYHPSVATKLGDFMGKTHAKTHCAKVPEEQRATFTKQYENREMRDVQLDFVFSKCYKEATDEQRAGLELTPAFLEEVELLKKQYNGENKHLVLSHGDLHPGSVMVNDEGKTKVIDPEFTVYGPPGLDVGSLLSGYCLAAIHQAYSDNSQAVGRIVDGAQAVWEAYCKAMKDEDFDDEALKEIAIETVGFTVAEVCRTALEFAGGRKWLQFENADTKAAAKKAALQLVGSCMIDRHQGGIELLFEQMKLVSVKNN